MRRQIRKMLQSLPKSLLSFRRQAAECGIVLECALLFVRRQILVASKPVPGVAMRLWRSLLLPRCLPCGRRGRMTLLRRVESADAR